MLGRGATSRDAHAGAERDKGQRPGPRRRTGGQRSPRRGILEANVRVVAPVGQMGGSSHEGTGQLALAVLSGPAEVVAFVGLTKNAGKTTALNALAQALTGRGERVGLASVGVDGEARDAFFDVPKPPIHVERGTLVATGELALARTTTPFRVRVRTGITTAFGETVVAEAQAPGEVLLAGVRHRQDLRDLRGRLADAGARRVLVDGAYHRLVAADPTFSDALVLAVGAAALPSDHVGPTPEAAVARQAAATLAILGARRCDDAGLRAALSAATADDIARAVSERMAEPAAPYVIDRVDLDADDLTPQVRALGSHDPPLRALCLPRSLTDPLLTALLHARLAIVVAVTDPTRILASEQLLERARAAGIRVQVGASVRLSCVVTNPVSPVPGAVPLSAPRLVAAVGAVARGLGARCPVVDVQSADWSAPPC